MCKSNVKLRFVQYNTGPSKLGKDITNKELTKIGYEFEELITVNLQWTLGRLAINVFEVYKDI